MSLARRLTSEFLGTAFLLSVVVGSGTLLERLAQGNVALVVLGVAFATGMVLLSLIYTFGSISAHFNPIVTLTSACRKEMPWKEVLPYFAAEISGGIIGVLLTQLMFGLPAVDWSQTNRTGAGIWLGEVIASFGLIGIILGCSRFKPENVPQAVAAYVTGAICFTSSTCFANPAVTIARIFTNTITGIAAADVLPFIAAQLMGAGAALLLFDWLLAADKAVVHPECRERLREIVDREERFTAASRD